MCMGVHEVHGCAWVCMRCMRCMGVHEVHGSGEVHGCA